MIGRVTVPVTEALFEHIPVLVSEVIEALRPESGKRYLDGTLGGGGHSEEILIKSSPAGEVLGLDRDEQAIGAASERLRPFKERFIARQASFADARSILSEIGWDAVHGVILDLGLSSHQLDAAERGFSFRADARLDMRMDRRQPTDAQTIVNSLAAEQLEQVLRDYGEEPKARRIAQAIVGARRQGPIQTTAELVKIIERIKGKERRRHHPATQVFQALRIAVNEELRHLGAFLENGFELLYPGGRMAVIAFHSLEDRMVKAAFRRWSRACLCPPRAMRCECGWSQKVKLITKKPIVPSAAERLANPRSRSAKLRVAERV